MDSGYMTIVQHQEYEKRMLEEHQRIHHRLKAVEDSQKEIHGLTLSVQELAYSVRDVAKEQKDQNEVIKEQRDDIETLKGRDGEMWRKVTSHVIMLVVGGVIAFMLDKIGM